ncbi:MAG: hypothetical protein WD000_10045 [Thermodesulfobacteriota bacterium]
MMIEYNKPKIILYCFVLSFALISFFFLAEMSGAELCGKWGEGQKIGVLDHNLINEASGLQVSRNYTGRLYHINDSGGGNFFYISDIKGDTTQKIRIEGEFSKKSDFEDISVGKCFDKSCLFIGDIGDNRATKDFVEIIIVPELEQYGTFVKPLKRIKIKYPDGPHNAEGMAVYPNGDIYIITKEENLKDLEAYPAKIYKLSAQKWQDEANKLKMLDYIGEIDLRLLNPSGTAYGHVVSAFDIAPDGKSFIILTYENAIEFNIDLSKQHIKPTSQLKEGQDYNVIELRSLPQQESITYLPSGQSFLYNTEYHWFEAPIIKVDCLD